MSGDVAHATGRARRSLANVRQEADWRELRELILCHALRMGAGPIFDFRRLFSDARTLEKAGRLIWRVIRPFSPEVLVGPGYGAAPLLASVAMAALADDVALTYLMVRDRRKPHHQKRWVEGRSVAVGARAIVIDDFMEGGTAVPLVERALSADGHVLDIRAVFVFFDMWQPLGSRQLSLGRYPVFSLFRRHDIGLSRDCFDAKPPMMKGDRPDFVENPLWWRYRLNDKALGRRKSVPVVAEDGVFVADDHSRVWKHDAGDGAIVWRYDSLADPLKGIVQALQYADGSLVFGCYDGTVTRLDAARGEPVWRWRQDSSVHATPALDLANNRLFVNTEQWNDGAPCGRLIAMDWSTGRQMWSLDHGWWPPGSPAYDADMRAVLATCNDHSLVCVDADTGEPRWQAETRGMVRGRPAVLSGRAYVADESGRLYCFDIATGELAWQVRYGQGSAHQFLQADDGVVLAVDAKWHCVALDAETGRISWITRLRGPAQWNPVRCGAHWVLLSRDGHLAVIESKSRSKLWEGAIGGRYTQPPAVGTTRHGTLLAAASNDEGLKVFRIHPAYLEPSGTDA